MALRFEWDDVPEKFINKSESCSSNIQLSIPENSNILVRMDNLPVLQSMVENGFTGKINLIYIDPPYNTGNKFTYNDNFSISSDHHSAWLSFMNRRLCLAKELLNLSGCIFIAIDQSELYVLKLLCDQIFGEENFINDFMWLHGKGKKDKWSRTLQQHTLCYARSKKNLSEFTECEQTSWASKNADDDPRGNWFSGSISFTETRSNKNHKNFYSIKSPGGKIWTRQWMVSQQEMEKLIKDNRIFWGHSPSYDKVPRLKIFNGESTDVIPKNIIDCVASTRAAQKHLDELLGEKNVFDNPKPVSLIYHLIKITGMPNDALILDFFAGSGTTFEAVCKVNKEDGGNRHCILIQQNEPVNNKQQSKFKTIAEICEERCKKTAAEFKSEIQII